MAPSSLTPELKVLTFAPSYFGEIVEWLFLGFVVTQFYTYMTSGRRDPLWLKVFVYFVVFISLASLGIATYADYISLVAGWGDETLIEAPPKAAIVGPAIKAVVALCVQNFYAWRIWVFLQRTISASLFWILIAASSIIQVAGGIGIPASFLSVDNQAEIAQHIVTFSYLWLICGLVNDLLITATMVVILRDARSRLITQHTKSLLGRLIRLTIQTGAFTSLLALATLVLSVYVSQIGLFQTFPASLLEFSYALSLLYNLNISVDQISRNSPESSFYVQTTSLHFHHNNRSRQSRKPETGPRDLSVHHDGHDVLALPSTSRTTIGELETVKADHDESSFQAGPSIDH